MGISFPGYPSPDGGWVEPFRKRTPGLECALCQSRGLVPGLERVSALVFQFLDFLYNFIFSWDAPKPFINLLGYLGSFYNFWPSFKSFLFGAPDFLHARPLGCFLPLCAFAQVKMTFSCSSNNHRVSGWFNPVIPIQNSCSDHAGIKFLLQIIWNPDPREVPLFRIIELSRRTRNCFPDNVFVAYLPITIMPYAWKREVINIQIF